jgi:hypothetical protein
MPGSIIDCCIGLVLYQRKDWINSDGKAVKPHDHEEKPGYEQKQGRNRSKAKERRTSERVRVRWVKREGEERIWVDTWDKEIFDLRPATTIELG